MKREGATVNVTRAIQAFNAGRDPERLALKYQKMRSSPFGFLRGSCHLFYDRLPESGLFKSAPLTWICGDLHLENFGSYKGNNRLAYFDLNDFDEAALAPASWELVRMLTSLLVGAESLFINPADARALCTIFVDSYAAALAAGKAYWIESETAQGVIRNLLVGLTNRKRADFLDTRTILKGKKRVLKVDGKKALAASDAQRKAVTEFMEQFAKTQSQPAFFKVLDVARRIAGTGSLGVNRYVILVAGKGSPNSHYLLDLKQTLPSSVAPHQPSSQPKWPSEAHRVVETQRRMQAVSVALLQPVRFDNASYVVRELQPLEDRVVLDHTHNTLDELKSVVTNMGQMLAWAQLRSSGRQGSAIADDLIAFGVREKWKAKLLISARSCATQVVKDSITFNLSYDAGKFNV